MWSTSWSTTASSTAVPFRRSPIALATTRVFLRALTRMGREVPLSPDTRLYVGDVMTMVGTTRNIERAATQVGQIVRSGVMLVGMGLVVTLVPLIVATLFAYHVLRMNPVITCGALAGAMTVDAAVTGCCEVAESQTPVLCVAVPYAVGNVVLTVLGPIIVACTFNG